MCLAEVAAAQLICLKFSVASLVEICEAELSTEVMPVLARCFHAKGGVREGEAEEKPCPSLRVSRSLSSAARGSGAAPTAGGAAGGG